MTDIHTIGDYQTAQTLETFGFMPKLSQNEVYDQISYLIAQGWTPAIVHEHPSRAFDHYWTMWKLPFFGEQDLNRVVQELDACRAAYPDNPARLLGPDNYPQRPGVAWGDYEGRG